MRAATVGINGLSFSALADCSPQFLSYLFNASPRGVVENRESFAPNEVWKMILDDNTFEQLLSQKILLSNIPLTSPTYGRPSLNMQLISLQNELEAMIETIKTYADKYVVVFSVNAYERDLRNKKDPCELMSLLDGYLRKAYELLDSYMFFSPYGFYENRYEPYGLYLSTVPRPSEDETIKLSQILDLIKMLGQP
ncbi:MAG: hypothetical protein ACP5GH_03900 [Nitrososphaeria archaeon]